MSDQPPPRKAPNKKLSFIMAVVFVIGAMLLVYTLDGANDAPPAIPLVEVRNTCAACGSSNLVGDWTADDGRFINLLDDQTYSLTADNGRQLSGTWRIDGDKLCLTDSVGGTSRCFPYEQKTDAMKLGDALYERQ